MAARWPVPSLLPSCFLRADTRLPAQQNEALRGQTRRRVVTRQENCVTLTSCFLQESLRRKRKAPQPPKAGISLARGVRSNTALLQASAQPTDAAGKQSLRLSALIFNQTSFSIQLSTRLGSSSRAWEGEHAAALPLRSQGCNTDVLEVVL